MSLLRSVARYESKLLFSIFDFALRCSQTQRHLIMWSHFLNVCVTGGVISALWNRMIGKHLISNCQDTLSSINEALFSEIIIIHINMATFQWDIDKQCGPRSDAAKCCI